MVLEKILPYFRSCADCGFGDEPVEWLCPACLNRFFQKIKPAKRCFGPNITHHYLVPWKGEDPFLKNIIHSLKGPGLHGTYELIMSFFLRGLNWEDFDGIYYPSAGTPDHASQMASVAGRYFCLEPTSVLKAPSPGVFPLSWGSGRKQSLLNREQRRERRFLSRKCRGKNPLLVDDIVTTGATLKACHKALGQPRNLTVWSLFYRKSL